jgi:subtilisin family serine protease
MPVRAFGPDGSGTDEATIKAIYYSIRMGARVINASWGDYDQAPLMKEAIRKAGEAGILFVAAAGNDAVNVDYEPFFPAGFPLENVVSVAAANRHDQEADFSNYGWRTVHVAAPGVEILSTYPGGTYGFSSGTSMAAPHVTGLAALLLSREPGLSPRQIRERLIRTSSRSRRYTRISVSGGRVHAGNLLADFVPVDPSPPESAWVSMPYSLETIHPYRNRTDQVFEIHVPGARFIRVVFDRFDLEGGWDAVTVSDDGEQGFDVLSGDFGEPFMRRASA